MAVASQDPDFFKREAEFTAVFGMHNATFDQYNYSMLDWMRDRYSHEQIMAGQVTFPAGHGFLGAASDAVTTVALVVKAAAPFIGMIPGIGTVAGAALEFGGSLASGDRIDAALVASVRQLLPVKLQPDYQRAVDLGYSIARGQKIGPATIDLARNEVTSKGGPAATAAFDAGIAIGSAQGLQDAGYAVFKNWLKNTDSETARILEFSDDVRIAAENHISVKDFLIGQARKEFFNLVPVAEQAYVLQKAINYFLAHPREMVTPDIADLAQRIGVPVEAIRAAIICLLKMADGSLLVDPLTARQFTAVTAIPSNLARDIKKFTTKNDSLALQGAAIAAADSQITALRNSTSYPPQITTNAEWRKGFDIGTAASHGYSAPSPDQDAIRSSLPTISQYNGFNAARAQQYNFSKLKTAVTKITTKSTAGSNIYTGGNFMYTTTAVLVQDQTKNNDYAAKGMVFASQDSRISAARSLSTDPLWIRGFDVAIGMTIGGRYTANGPGQTAVKTSLSSAAGIHQAGIHQPLYSGFDVGQALAYGINKEYWSAQDAIKTKSISNPTVAAGALVASGLSGSGQSVEQKTATLTTIATNNDARQGIAVAVQHESLWHKLLAFFGLV